MLSKRQYEMREKRYGRCRTQSDELEQHERPDHRVGGRRVQDHRLESGRRAYAWLPFFIHYFGLHAMQKTVK